MNFLSFIKKGNKPLENCFAFFLPMNPKPIHTDILRVCVLCMLWALFLMTPHFLSYFKWQKMIQKRFWQKVWQRRENWKNSAGFSHVYSFNYLHFPLTVLHFRFLSWEYSDTNFRSFWHYRLSNFHATPLTNPYKCSSVILNYSLVVIKVELVHNAVSDSEKEGWVGRLRL